MRMEMEMTLEWKGMIGTGTWELGAGTGKRYLACPECKLRVRVAFNEA